MHVFSNSFQHLQIFLQDLVKASSHILHLICPCHIASSIYTCRTMHIDDCVSIVFYLIMELLDQAIDVVKINLLADKREQLSRPVGHLRGVQQRPQDDPVTILSDLFIFAKEFLLDVLVFCFLGSKSIQKAYNDKFVSGETRELGEVCLEFLDLKLFLLVDRKISPNKKSTQPCVAIYYSQSLGDELRMSERSEEYQQIKLQIHEQTYKVMSFAVFSNIKAIRQGWSELTFQCLCCKADLNVLIDIFTPQMIRQSNSFEEIQNINTMAGNNP